MKPFYCNILLTFCQTLYFKLTSHCKQREGKGSTARIAIAQKLGFQPNPKIRCFVLDNFQKKRNFS